MTKFHKKIDLCWYGNTHIIETWFLRIIDNKILVTAVFHAFLIQHYIICKSLLASNSTQRLVHHSCSYQHAICVILEVVSKKTFLCEFCMFHYIIIETFNKDSQ